MQTARLTDPMNGEAKMEFRGHDNVVEVVAFAPVAAYAAIRELGGLPVGQDVLLIARFFDKRVCERLSGRSVSVN